MMIYRVKSLSGDEEMDSDWYILTLSQDDSKLENVTRILQDIS